MYDKLQLICLQTNNYNGENILNMAGQQNTLATPPTAAFPLRHCALVYNTLYTLSAYGG